MINLVVFVIISFLCLLLGRYFNPDQLTGFGWADGGIQTASGLGLVLAVLAMLLGIVAGVLFEKLGDSSGAVSSNELIEALRSRRLLKAVLVSPIVFFSLVSDLKGFQDIVMASVFAFQNGFFWQKALTSAGGKA